MAFNRTAYTAKPYKAPVFPSETQTAEPRQFPSRFQQGESASGAEPPQFLSRFQPGSKKFASVAGPQGPSRFQPASIESASGAEPQGPCRFKPGAIRATSVALPQGAGRLQPAWKGSASKDAPQFLSRFASASKEFSSEVEPQGPSRFQPASKGPASRAQPEFLSRFQEASKESASVVAPQFPSRFQQASKRFATGAEQELPRFPSFSETNELASPHYTPPTPLPGAKPFSGVKSPQFDLQRQDQDNQQYQGEAQITPPPADPDPFVGCNLVPGLTMDNFLPYVNAMEATFVMFYDPMKPMSSLAKLHIRGAAQRTKRPNHKYVAVDCSDQEKLCSQQGITQTPAYKLFSRGSLVSTYEDVETIRAAQIQNYVEMCPVIDNRTPMSCKH